MIAEGMRNRRGDLVEKSLEEVYSPLYQILHRSFFRLGQFTRKKDGGWDLRLNRSFATLPPPLHPLTKEELDRICRITERFGHLIPSEDFLNLTSAITACVFDAATDRWQFEDWDNKIWFRIIEMKDRFEKELTELTTSRI